MTGTQSMIPSTHDGYGTTSDDFVRLGAALKAKAETAAVAATAARHPLAACPGCKAEGDWLHGVGADDVEDGTATCECGVSTAVEVLPDGTIVRSFWVADGIDPWLVETLEAAA